MTRFRRDGFYRTSMYGNTHWVHGHWVDREEWSRSGNVDATEDNYRSLLDSARVRNSRAARFVNPNANCPVCGEPVFFYQNEYGSRVFFDEVGPPWPKHPCTDNANWAHHRKGDADARQSEPYGRNVDDVATIESWITSMWIDPQFEFEEKYRSKPWVIASVAKRIKGAAGVFLVVDDLEWIPPKRRFLVCKTLPKSVREGTVIAIKKHTLSFFDFTAMTPREVDARRISRASAFVEELASR